MEDLLNNFLLDIGKIDMYCLFGGFGVCLDVGNVYVGYVVMLYFDLLLVKVCMYGVIFEIVI